jgi:hypothetical protein
MLIVPLTWPVFETSVQTHATALVDSTLCALFTIINLCVAVNLASKVIHSQDATPSKVGKTSNFRMIYSIFSDIECEYFF